MCSFVRQNTEAFMDKIGMDLILYFTLYNYTSESKNTEIQSTIQKVIKSLLVSQKQRDGVYDVDKSAYLTPSKRDLPDAK